MIGGSCKSHLKKVFVSQRTDKDIFVNTALKTQTLSVLQILTLS